MNNFNVWRFSFILCGINHFYDNKKSSPYNFINKNKFSFCKFILVSCSDILVPFHCKDDCISDFVSLLVMIYLKNTSVAPPRIFVAECTDSYSNTNTSTIFSYQKMLTNAVNMKTIHAVSYCGSSTNIMTNTNRTHSNWNESRWIVCDLGQILLKWEIKTTGLVFRVNSKFQIGERVLDCFGSDKFFSRNVSCWFVLLVNTFDTL